MLAATFSLSSHLWYWVDDTQIYPACQGIFLAFPPKVIPFRVAPQISLPPRLDSVRCTLSSIAPLRHWVHFAQFKSSFAALYCANFNSRIISIDLFQNHYFYPPPCFWNKIHFNLSKYPHFHLNSPIFYNLKSFASAPQTPPVFDHFLFTSF